MVVGIVLQHAVENMILLGWRGCFYTDVHILYFFFLISTKKELTGAQLLTFFWPSPTDSLDTPIYYLFPRAGRGISTVTGVLQEWLRYLLTQPFTGAMQTSRTRDKITVGLFGLRSGTDVASLLRLQQKRSFLLREDVCIQAGHLCRKFRWKKLRMGGWSGILLPNPICFRKQMSKCRKERAEVCSEQKFVPVR